MREIGGRTERLAASSEIGRFGFGVCGSINETVSTTGLGGGAGAAGASGFGTLAGFRAVMGAKAERVGATVAAGLRGEAGGFSGAGAGLVASITGSFAGVETVTSSWALLLDVLAFAGLAAALERVDDFAEAVPLAAALRAGAALGALVLVVVVFVGI